MNNDTSALDSCNDFENSESKEMFTGKMRKYLVHLKGKDPQYWHNFWHNQITDDELLSEFSMRTEKQKKVLIDYFLRNHSLDRIAIDMNITASGARQAIKRAMTRISWNLIKGTGSGFYTLKELNLPPYMYNALTDTLFPSDGVEELIYLIELMDVHSNKPLIFSVNGLGEKSYQILVQRLFEEGYINEKKYQSLAQRFRVENDNDKEQ